MKMKCCLFLIDLNQLIIAVVVFHWLKLRFFAVKDLFAVFACLELHGVDESAGWLLWKVLLVVLIPKGFPNDE